VLVKGSSYENRANLSEAGGDTVVAPLEGTRTGRQEIEAELLEDVEGALWTRPR
jgi:phage terminase large subunit-like protein